MALHTHTHTHTLIFNRNKIKKRFENAFTLAEVLITLAVIGIVAALTIGVFLPKIHSTIRARQIATAEVKFTKAMEQMALNNAIGPYYETTQEFVDELQNYLKISKVCTNDKLEECFGYDKIKLGEGDEYEIKNIKNGKILGMEDNYGETIGLVTIDGTGIILSWNKECPILEPKVYEWSGNTNETTSCVAMVMDINLDKAPNILNKDIVLFGAEQIGSACGMEFKVDGKKYCWGTPFRPHCMPISECYEKASGLGIKYCKYNNSYDCWAGIVNECGGTANMPSGEDLAAFAKYIYGTNNSLYDGDVYTDKGGFTMNLNTLSNLSPVLRTEIIPRTNGSGYAGAIVIWSNAEYDASYAWTSFLYYDSYTYQKGYERQYSNPYGICKLK